MLTVDGRGDEPVLFDFSSGSVVESPDPLGWDLAFRRFTILANGGPDFAGQGGILDLGIASLDSPDERFRRMDTPRTRRAAK